MNFKIPYGKMTDCIKEHELQLVIQAIIEHDHRRAVELGNQGLPYEVTLPISKAFK